MTAHPLSARLRGPAPPNRGGEVRRPKCVRIGLVALLAWAVILLAPCALAVDNLAKGGIGGIDNGTMQYGDGSGQARISLFSVDLALVKQARDPSGNVLPDAAPVSPGQDLWFVLYVDNPTAAAATDVRLNDQSLCGRSLFQMASRMSSAWSCAIAMARAMNCRSARRS